MEAILYLSSLFLHPTLFFPFLEGGGRVGVLWAPEKVRTLTLSRNDVGNRPLATGRLFALRKPWLNMPSSYSARKGDCFKLS